MLVGGNHSENAHAGGVFKIILIGFGLKSDDMGAILLFLEVRIRARKK